ncbi:MAG TPA: restriction endonuclease subunit S [Clostridiales bacterium]|nr:restriction endonuclease subunit S [Clostridiales bacterium]HQP69387.1 restriction endonuclease subunit S [Clostridiales bacterium]
MKSHSDKNTKQPKLRFPGFTEEWQEKRLGEIGKITTGSTPSTFVEKYYNGEYLFVSPFDISDKKYIFTTQKTLTEEGFKKTRNIKKCSVLFVCIGSTIGKIAVAGTDLATNQQINAITCEHEAQNEFVYYSLLKKADQIKLMAGEQAVPIINKSNFETVKLPMTSPAEQKKISEFLSDIDTKIEKLTRKKELTEQYKKGAMQKIFSQKIRFKDDNGKNYPDWQEKRLGEVATIKRGASSQYLKYVNNSSEGVRLIRITDFLESEPVFIKESLELDRFKLKKDDILIAGTGATAGITFKVPDKFIGMVYSYNVPQITPVSCDPNYLIQFLKSDSISKQQEGLFTGNAQHFLDIKAISNLKLPLQCA